MSAVLAADGLVKRFGGLTAVDEVDLRIDAGEIHGLIGPNGSGKTTIINLVSGVYGLTGGALRLDDHDIARVARHRRARLGIARTFQGIRLFETMTVQANVEVGARHGRRRREGARPTATEALALVGMADRADLTASALPYGDQRMVEIARAVALDPRLLLLDEPVAGMAPEETERVGTVIRRLSAAGVAVLLVEHEMAFVLGVCHQVSVLNFGRRIAVGRPEEIRTDPEVVRAYLGEPAGDDEEDLLGAP